jgi:tRNA(Ile)-lysidine synthase
VAERCVAVAYSGGRDSTALLHATAGQAAVQGVRVLALHVHHGLSPHADAWLAHGQAQCRRWSRTGRPIEFIAHRVEGRPARGESVEAWAREARYRALREMALANGAGIVLLAHHQRDQAETFVLQALRGAGVAGLAGMPISVQRDGITWHRPWLAKPRSEIDAYVRRHRLKHIDDDSNADPRFARNRLRLQVWPVLSAAFAHTDAALASSAEWAQQASAALDELAVLDLRQCATPQGLVLEPWLALSIARRSNALRAWLRQQHGAGAPASLITRLLDELPRSRSARWPLGADELRVHRGVLGRQAGLASPPGDSLRETTLSLRRAGRHAVPGWGGTLHVERVRDAGVPMAWLAHLELRARAGAERFQAGIGRPPRSLKKQFQQAGVPAWERAGPLIYSGGQLVFVPGLGLDARVIGLPGQPMATLRWVPAEPKR